LGEEEAEGNGMRREKEKGMNLNSTYGEGGTSTHALRREMA